MEDNIIQVRKSEIDINYEYRSFLGIEIIVELKTGYINGSRICSIEKKRLDKWLDTKRSRLTIRRVCKAYGLTKEELFIDKLDLSNDLRGIYVHRDLVQSIASWSNPEFELKVIAIINDIVDKEYRSTIRKQEKVIRKKDEIIEELYEEIKEMKKQNKESFERIYEENRKTHEKCERILEGVVTLCHTRVVNSSNPNDDNCFYIFKKNSDDEKYQYTAVRRSRKTMGAFMRRFEEQFPESKAILNFNYDPNSINYWLRLKEYIKKRIECSGMKFNMKKGYNEQKLIRDARIVRNKKYDDGISLTGKKETNTFDLSTVKKDKYRSTVNKHIENDSEDEIIDKRKARNRNK